MKAFAIQVGISILATGLALGICCLVAWALNQLGFIELQNYQPLIAAGAVSLVVGVFLVLFFTALGISAAALVFGSLLRVGMTLGGGAAVAWGYGYWNHPFFVTLAVIYIANLGVETWMVYEENRKQFRKRASSV